MATKKKGAQQVQLLRGMKDVLPEDAPYWQALRERFLSIAASYSFSEIQLPILESKDLFVRGVGQDTDIVSKEMFTFMDHGESVVLRPEFTASFARAYIEHGMLSRPQPVKLFHMGPAFRRERPQAGRQRQFHQFDFEIMGSASATMDAEIIVLSYGLCTDFRLDVEVHVNSIGDPQSRKDYIKALVQFVKPHKKALCADCNKRLEKNPLRILDCKNKKCQTILEEAPEIVDFLDEESRAHFVEVLEHLDAAEVPYILNSKLVRGLDYYNRTVFEIIPTGDESRQGTLMGGGRYDGLVKMLGGRAVPAVGVAGGVERLLQLVKANEKFTLPVIRPDIFVAQLGDRTKRKALYLFEHLRKNGFHVVHDFSSSGLRDQLGTADKLRVKYTLVLGQKEMMDETVMVRDMENGSQEVVDIGKIAADMAKRLRRAS